MTQIPGPWVEAWLSAPRFGVYLAAAGGDRERALALYEWNTVISAALLHDLAHLEVGLRNAYDAALSAGPFSPHWVFHGPRLFPPTWKTARNGTRYDANQINRDQLLQAIDKAGAPGPAARPGLFTSAPPPGKVLAELNFGFWRYLSTSAHAHRLWVPSLHKAFQPGTGRRDVDEPMRRLHQLRNRVAHHEPLLTALLPARVNDFLAVAGLIAPELNRYLRDTSQVSVLIARRP